ncbi:MAG: hypothetical protein CBC49_009035 [Alphaproteobacteria bacterium TMED89]|nr:hypothetical protein [Rhodospirillaceae bacterium]MAV48183.1 hypothetical protein [Rhodospirillaceae bacterium]RPH11928.1 MAG: hypothetical protein CBC49_008840 [Alphaproteobacteria bacterium TMED89]RPH11959.1 MAG: hypothetical protein CBC49_009035 [Alphaproteobacteria bacterium TMED89]RZO29694.1 MAG: hypothetical protein EVA88_03775 [Rhodospirillaceae bacterium]
MAPLIAILLLVGLTVVVIGALAIPMNFFRWVAGVREERDRLEAELLEARREIRSLKEELMRQNDS